MVRLVALLLLLLAPLAEAAAAPWPALVHASEVRERLATPGLRIVDLRGSAAYAQGHADGAVSMPVARWQAGAGEGRLPEVIGAAGIHPDRPLLLVHYDTGAANFVEAAWIAWTLKTRGIRSVSVLEGGMAAWEAEGIRQTTRVHDHRTYTLAYPRQGGDVVARTALEAARRGPLRVAHVSVGGSGRGSGDIAPAVVLDELLAQPELLRDRAALLERVKNAPVPWGADGLVLDGDTLEAAPALWFLASEVLGIRGIAVAEPPAAETLHAQLEG